MGDRTPSPPPRCCRSASPLPQRSQLSVQYDADDLDFFAGMGEQNVEEFGVIFEGEAAHRASAERQRDELMAVAPEELVEAWQSLLGPADRALATGQFASALLEHLACVRNRNVDGWLDDDIAFTRPWGFDLGSIHVPVQLWQGEQDKFSALRPWRLAGEADPRVSMRTSRPRTGHLTLHRAPRYPEVHAWLLQRFNA